MQRNHATIGGRCSKRSNFCRHVAAEPECATIALARRVVAQSAGNLTTVLRQISSQVESLSKSGGAASLQRPVSAGKSKRRSAARCQTGGEKAHTYDRSYPAPHSRCSVTGDRAENTTIELAGGSHCDPQTLRL